MSVVWSMVNIDASKEDQVQDVYNLDTGATTSTLLQTWIMQTDGITPNSVAARADPVQARTAAVSGGNALPIVGGTLLAYSNYTVTSVQPKRTGPYSFEAQVQAQWKFTPDIPGGANKSNISIDFSGQKITQDCYNDSTGAVIVNSANQSLNPGIPKTFYDERISISYITKIDQSAAFATVRGKVNNATLSFNIKGVNRTFAQRDLLCEDVRQTSTFQFSSGALSFSVQAEFIGCGEPGGFVARPLDQGMFQLSGGVLSPIMANNSSGVLAPVTSPVRLNGSGLPLPFNASSGSSVFLTYKMESEADFTSIFTELS